MLNPFILGCLSFILIVSTPCYDYGQSSQQSKIIGTCFLSVCSLIILSALISLQKQGLIGVNSFNWRYI